MNLKEFSEIEETKDSIVAKLKYLKDGGLDEYLDFAIAEMGLKKLPKKSSDQIIQQIIAKTPNDLNKKVATAEHYTAHLCCLKIVLEEMFLHDKFIESIENYTVEEGKDMVIYNYHKILWEILFDMVLLIQDYNQVINNKPPTGYSVGKNLFQRDFNLYQLLPQIIFGQVSFHSFIEREPFVAIAIIRQVIELKIRRAFGVMGVYDKSKDSFEPLPLGQIFDEIKPFASEIDFAIPLENIRRINGWSNIFMHSGMKDYTWTIIFVYSYLHELIKGRKDGKGWSSESGIKIKQDTLDKVVDSIEKKYKEKNSEIELHRFKPEAYIIN